MKVPGHTVAEDALIKAKGLQYVKKNFNEEGLRHLPKGKFYFTLFLSLISELAIGQITTTKNTEALNELKINSINPDRVSHNRLLRI